MISILIVEDEKAISNLIKMSLMKSSYHCECVFDGKSAEDIIETKRFDLILLDVMLPECSGFDLMDFIKEYDIPTIFLTAKNSTADKVKGLKLGAEDYITKPFDISELLARIEVVLRRYQKEEPAIDIDDIHIDLQSRTVTKKGVVVDLTVKEFDILILFLKNKNIALYRETIYERVWHDSYMPDTRTVDLHIQRLRKKLSLEDKIKSIYKIGYMYQEG